MKNKSFLLISLSILVAILASSSVMAAEVDNSTNTLTENIAINDNIVNVDNIADNNIASSNNIVSSEIANPNDLSTKTEDINTKNENGNENQNLNDNDISNYKTSTKDINSDEISVYTSNGNIITVDGNSTNQMDNPTIQTAINSASAGDTILITGTHYVHTHLVIDKQLNITTNVGTIIETCPSNTQGSNGLGIFYISPGASGTIISGFTLINDGEAGNAVDPYGIYVNGANNVLITNCTVTRVNAGQGILINNGNNITVNNSTIQKSKAGIIVKNSNNTKILNNTLSGNTITGLVIGDGNSNTTIKRNDISSNTISGINLTSSENVDIVNNTITYNRNGIDQSRSTLGMGIYVNCNITKINILGNFIFENGNYGIFNDYRVRNLNNQNIEIIKDNYFGLHNTRAAFTAVYTERENGNYDYDPDTDTFYKVTDGTGHYSQGTNPIFLWGNMYIGELFCGATYYAPGVLRDGSKDIIIGNISQVSPGVYTLSFVYKNGSIATGLNSVYTTIFLNKNNTLPQPQDGETYKTVLVENGIATVDFRAEEFKDSGNNITAISPGMGSIGSANRPTAYFNITDIPGPATIMTVENVTLVPKSGENYTATLTDINGNPLAGKDIDFILTNNLGESKTYYRTTNTAGIAKLTINLAQPSTYTMKCVYKGNAEEGASDATGTIVIANKVGNTALTVSNFVTTQLSGENFTAILKDENGTVLAGQDIAFKLINRFGESKTYYRTTNTEGVAKLIINLAQIDNYTIECTFTGKGNYDPAGPTPGSLEITAQKKTLISSNLANNEIQSLIDASPSGYTIEFLGTNYNDISLNINKELNIISNVGTTLNGKSNSTVFTINSAGAKTTISNFNIKANSGSGFLLNNVENVNIANNNITNTLDTSKINDYNNGSTLLPGNGILISGSKNSSIKNNQIQSFENGILLKNSENIIISSNSISKSNYGITYGEGVNNTQIINNNISNNIGWYVLDVPEGPRGYGIYLKDSAVNVLIHANNITYNYLGISIDCNNSTGIIITSNLINENSLEGLRFNAGYDLAANAIEPNVTNNAIYNNAKGPSMFILGEVSANPEGIYGPGQWNDSLKLKLGANWYGMNSLETWNLENGTTGPGTICPRISTSPIYFRNITCTSPGTYSIQFYNNGSLATELPDFTVFFSFDINKIEKEVKIVNGTGIVSFEKELYDPSNNTIEISAGSLNSEERHYKVIFTYNIPNSEIPI